MHGLLFLNGEPPHQLPIDAANYAIIACTDGAYSSYLQGSNITLDYLIGDLDSLSEAPTQPNLDIILTPDQNKTDFEKALLFLQAKGITTLTIYGASGRASDHFLGNLTVALRYYADLNITFVDNYGTYFFAPHQTTLTGVKGKTISLIPFPAAADVTLTGFVYPLSRTDLTFTGLVSLRNQAQEDTVNINFTSGALLVFVNQ